MVNSLGRVALFLSVWFNSFGSCNTFSQCVVNSLGRVALLHSVRLIVLVV